MADPRDLTTLAGLKAWLNLTATADDALLQNLITAVSVFIQNWLSRPIAQADYTETRDGTGGQTLVLTYTPVIAIASLTIDGVSIPPAADPLGTGYRLAGNRLSLTGYCFWRRHANVVITYSAGYADIPPDLAQAAIQVAATRYRERDRIGLASKGLAGETTAFSLKDLPADIALLLQQYRRVVPL